MNHVSLGRSGLQVSELVLGTNAFGSRFGDGADRSESGRILDAYLTAGGNHVDACGASDAGASDAFLGLLLAEAGARDRVILAAGGGTAPFRPAGPVSQRRQLVQSVERSLMRLCTDYLDLLWVSPAEFMAPIEEVMHTLDSLVRQGKVLYLGLADTPAWVLAQANTLASANGWTPFTAARTEYSLFENRADEELFPAVRMFGMSIVARASGGWGLPPAPKGEAADLESAGAPGRPVHPKWVRDDAIRRAVSEVARVTGSSQAQVALNWARAKGVMPVLEPARCAELASAVAGLRKTLASPHVAQLDAAARTRAEPPGSLDAQSCILDGGTLPLRAAK